MSPDRGQGRHYWVFTSWQWAVLGAYLVAIVLSLVVLRIAHRADHNTAVLSSEICYQIRYLDRLSAHAATPQAGRDIRQLVVRLKSLNTKCESERSR